MNNTEIKQWLKYGDQNLIARVCKCNKMSVSRAVNGNSSPKNSSILYVAERLAQKRKQQHLEDLEKELSEEQINTHK